MYPLDYFNLFPPFPREAKIFVAMGFDAQFNTRWKKVIAQGISNVQVNGVSLQPYRVDARKVSDSILTEILGNISNCRLIFSDVTAYTDTNGRAIRNGNVMYEVGLAHAVRLPEEVILFRSDDAPLLFDIANVRVNKYDPDDDPVTALNLVSEAIRNALKEIDLQKSLAVQRVADALDFASCNILMWAWRESAINPPVVRTMGDALGNAANLNAISRLLELGVLTTEYMEVMPENLGKVFDAPFENLFKYHLTAFGKAVSEVVMARLGALSPELQKQIRMVESERAKPKQE